MKTPFESQDLSYNYIIGIDLGTTNSAVAYVDLTQDPPTSGKRPIRFFEIPQLVEAGGIANRSILPSFMYLPGEYDLPPGSAALPWDQERTFIAGEFAREQGAKVPGRLVASAKSWLCHAGVDRSAAILPWGASEEIAKVSPVEASMRYLQHIREAWDERKSGGREEDAFDQQLVVLTVPASFDEVARELTVSAAQKAGIPRVVLVEEPLAAFYAWLSRNEKNWQEDMSEGQLILVCDVGGGTTDFSIVGIVEGEKGLRFNRLAVGDHLMLGGDNMDLTLGRYLENEIMGAPGKLDTRRWHQLVYQCRKAKETLLGAPDTMAKMDITVMGAAGKLIAGTIKSSLSQYQIQQLIVDGFFPKSNLDEAPGQETRKGLTEFGLPYVQDPAITRHLGAFWKRFGDLLREETGREAVYPDYVLYNGGALTPQSIREHLSGVIGSWFETDAGKEWQPSELDNPRPELAVAVGAAYYGMVRQGEGVRVGSGSPRSYYVAVQADANAATEESKSSVCLVPRGTEEGAEIHLEQLNFEALANRPVEFQMFYSGTRLGDKLGEIVALSEDEITSLPAIRTVLRFGKKDDAKAIPVNIAARLTEIGTLELWCESKATDHRWQLQFDARRDADKSESVKDFGETIDLKLIELGQEKIAATFAGGDASKQNPPESLMKSLAKILEMRKEKWPTPIIRKLVDTLMDVAENRHLTATHEARWLNLLGFCQRPGYGDPLDEWRLKQMWKLWFQGVRYNNDAQTRADWWTFWRRVAGGLTAGKQIQIYQSVFSALQAAVTGGKISPKKRLQQHEELEVWMALANFERLNSDDKVKLGRLLLQKIRKGKPRPQELWAISRFGARNPIYGPIDRLIPAVEVADWIKTLTALKIEKTDQFAHALVHLSRITGDRERDISGSTRDQVLSWLEGQQKGDQFKDMLLNPESAATSAEQDWMFGESLPAGLVLTTADSES